METLAIDFESTFEALPGSFLLLKNNPPSFTIAAVSSEYLAKFEIDKHECKEKSIFELYLDFEFKWDHTLYDSLETVARTRLPHAFDYTAVVDDSLQNYNISNHPVIGKSGDVEYIIHRLTVLQKWNFDSLHKETLTVGTLIEQAPVAMALVRGEDFVIECINERMCSLWGKARSIVGRPLLEALPELTDQPFPNLLRQVYRTGIAYEGKEERAELKRNDKIEELYFNFVYAPLKNANVVTSILMIASDVSNLVKGKKALEESENRYRDLIAGATVATAVYEGPEMYIKLANDAMLQLWGKDRSVIGRKLEEALPEIEGQPFLRLLKHVYQTGETYHSTEDKADLIVNGQLQTFYFNFTYKALRDLDGKIYGILNMGVDVSDIVKTKLQLKEHEERWRLALHSAELGTWDYYPETKKFICSERTKVLHGAAANVETDFNLLLDAVVKSDIERVKHAIRETLSGEGSPEYNVEYGVIGIKDGVKRWLRTTGQAFYNQEGKAYRLTGTVLDITDRKKIEEALEEAVNSRTAELIAANKELERSNHELEQYAYVASHDLQEPLRKILVYSDMLKSNAKSPSTSQEDRLEKIIGSARRMSLLIQDLLNFSKLVKAETVTTPVDLQAVIKNVLEDFELMLNETGATINIGELPVVEGSAREMNQLFYNLISNGLKFRKEGTHPVIDISSAPVRETELANWKELDPKKAYCKVSVRDNGIGFNNKYGPQIFEIFKRLNTKNKFEGTGIGLAVCRKIASKHSGVIYAESQEGKGAIFHVILPAKI